MYQKESVYNRYVDSQAGRDYHYKLTSYLENQASMIQAAHRQGHSPCSGTA